MGPLLQGTRTVPIVFNNVADPVGERNQIFRVSANCGGIASGPPSIDPHIVAVGPSGFVDSLAFIRQRSEQTGTNRRYSARSDVEPTWTAFVPRRDALAPGRLNSTFSLSPLRDEATLP